MTFAEAFRERGIEYIKCPRDKTELYELLEPALNACEVEALDIPLLQEQLLTLVVKGAKIDHESGNHDDWANALAGLVFVGRNRFTEQAAMCSPVMISGPARAVPGGLPIVGQCAAPVGAPPANAPPQHWLQQQEPWRSYMDYPGETTPGRKFWGADLINVFEQGRTFP
jgi:hypothetical protein